MDEITQLPPKPKWGKIFSWGIPSIIMIIIISSFINNINTGLEVTKTWIFWNGLLAGIGTIFAKGHILTILTAFIVAPLSSLNPALAAGWFAGLTEAYLRKPQVKDFQKLSGGMSIKEIYSNKVTHILLIVILANLGSIAGTAIGGANVIRIFLDLFSF